MVRAARPCDRARMPKAVLIDVDGTLVDSNDAHARSWVDVLAECGHPTSFERVRPLIGMGGDKLLPAVSGVSEDSPEGKRISERRREVFLTRYLPALRAFPRAADLLRRMRADGLKLVVATSANDEELRPLLRVAGVEDLIDGATSSDDAERSKPDPDIVAAALQRSGAPAAEALMLGDPPYDVEAATRAGVGVIALRCGGWTDDELRGAREIYDDPADRLAHYDRSAFAVR